MGSTSIFIWRVRLCLVLTAVGLVFVNTGKHGPAQQDNAAISVSHVKCPPPGSRNSAALQRPGAGSAAAADSQKNCSSPSGPAALRTSGIQAFKPEVSSTSLGALAGR